MADCNGKICGDDGCGGVCGWCPGAWSCIDGQCVNNCVPICAGKQCGDDGCGGSCGVCGPSENCIHHQCAVPCVPICAGKECGADGCGGQCGNCPVDYFCEANQCVILYPDDVVIEEVVEPHDLLDDRDVPDILYPDAESPDSRAILPDAAGPSDGSGGFEVRSDVKQPLNCGPGMKNQLGQCVPDDPEEPQPEPAASSGCHSSHQTSPGALLLLVLLVLSTLVMRLRPWRIPS